MPASPWSIQVASIAAAEPRGHGQGKRGSQAPQPCDGRIVLSGIFHVPFPQHEYETGECNRGSAGLLHLLLLPERHPKRRSTLIKGGKKRNEGPGFVSQEPRGRQRLRRGSHTQRLSLGPQGPGPAWEPGLCVPCVWASVAASVLGRGLPHPRESRALLAYSGGTGFDVRVSRAPGVFTTGGGHVWSPPGWQPTPLGAEVRRCVPRALGAEASP